MQLYMNLMSFNTDKCLGAEVVRSNYQTDKQLWQTVKPADWLWVLFLK